MATISDLVVELKLKADQLDRELKNSTKGIEKFEATVNKEMAQAKADFNKFVLAGKKLSLKKEYNAALRGATTFRKRLQLEMAYAGRTFSALKQHVLSAKVAIVGLVASLGGLYAIKNLITVGAEFSDKLAELSAITGATGADLKVLSDASKEFGTTTRVSATEAADAFKLVASAKPDLLKNIPALKAVTKQVILLSQAAGIDLAEASKTVGQSLNQFSADADQASRFVNVLAAGAKLGASEVQDTSAALLEAGTVAKQAGISFAQTNAAIQALAQDGIKAQKAGVGLRNTLLILSSQTNSQINPSIVGLSKALENLGNMNLSTADKVKMFGRENVVVANSLIKNQSTLNNLTTALEGTNVALEQSTIRTNTLAGQGKILKNTFDVLKISISKGVEPVLIDLSKELTNTLKKMIDVENGSNRMALTILDAISSILKAISVLNLAFSALNTTLDSIAAGFKTVGEWLGKRAAYAKAGVESGVYANPFDPRAREKYSRMTKAIDEGGTPIADAAREKVSRDIENVAIIKAGMDTVSQLNAALKESMEKRKKELQQVSSENKQLTDAVKKNTEAVNSNTNKEKESSKIASLAKSIQSASATSFERIAPALTLKNVKGIYGGGGTLSTYEGGYGTGEPNLYKTRSQIRQQLLSQGIRTSEEELDKLAKNVNAYIQKKNEIKIKITADEKGLIKAVVESKDVNALVDDSITLRLEEAARTSVR